MCKHGFWSLFIFVFVRGPDPAPSLASSSGPKACMPSTPEGKHSFTTRLRPLGPLLLVGLAVRLRAHTPGMSIPEHRGMFFGGMHVLLCLMAWFKYAFDITISIVTDGLFFINPGRSLGVDLMGVLGRGGSPPI